MNDAEVIKDLFNAAQPDPDEDEIRTSWRRLVEQTLPRTARGRRDWPVYQDHCFARILLDNAVGQMWREVIPAPAWKNTPLPVLQTAIDLGEAVLSDEADLWALNNRSLAMRGKAPRRKKPAPHRKRNRPLKSKHSRAAQAQRFGC